MEVRGAAADSTPDAKQNERGVSEGPIHTWTQQQRTAEGSQRAPPPPGRAAVCTDGRTLTSHTAATKGKDLRRLRSIEQM